MPYPAHHRENVRLKIVRAARELFNSHGYSNISIDNVMAAAGLTRGGFYTYFRNKDELFAEAITHILVEHPAENWEGVNFDLSGPDIARVIVEAYLSRQHFDEIGTSCPLIAQPSDVARAGPVVKEAFEKVLNSMVDLFEHNIGETPLGKNPRDGALALAALCVGGMVLARAVSSETLSDEVREVARRSALELGGWALHEERAKYQ